MSKPEMTMTSRERVIRAIDRKPTDVIPVGPFMFDLAATYYGVSVGEFANDGRVMADAQIALQKELGQDIIFVGVDNYYIAGGFGCEVDTPDDEIPHLAKPALQNIADVYKLEVPDPLTDGRMPVMLEATRRVRDVLGDSIFIRTPGTGPFALASYFIGTQEFLVEVGLAEAGFPESNPEAIHHALDLAADALIAFGIACWDAGADLLHCGDSLASCDMISPAQYHKWAFPYQRKVISAWKAYGARTLLHICGDSTKVLELYADTGADVVEIDHKVDLAYAKATIGHRTCILGNVDTVDPLLLGTPDEVRAASEKCIADAAAGGGFILGAGCMVPRIAPVENVKAMVEVARSHSNQF
jgi:uroporphyrinogen decarboxylase